jgi:plastocyanin
MHKPILPIVVLLLIIGGAVYSLQQNDVATDIPDLTSQEVVIRYTDEGYTPESLAIKKGTEVTFLNESSRNTWPASVIHPTHRVYPETDIDKCGKVPESSIFDACRGLKPGESWLFEFDRIGTWGYHDHLNPRHFGLVTVE